MEERQLFQVCFREKFSAGCFEKINIVEQDIYGAVANARLKLLADAKEGDWYETDEEKQEYIKTVKDLKVAFVSYEGQVLV